MEITGFDGQTRIVSAASIAASTSGPGRAVSAPANATSTTGGAVRSRTNHSCIARTSVVPSGRRTVTRVATRSSDIGSRRGCTPHGVGDLGGDLGEGRALLEPAGAVEVGREVAVAEPEPGRLAVAVERVHHAEALVGEAPALLGVLGAGERVGDGVEVGGDGEAVEAVVVGGVHDHRDRGRVDDPDEPAQEAGGSDSTGERDDHPRSVGTVPTADRMRAADRAVSRTETTGTPSGEGVPVALP